MRPSVENSAQVQDFSNQSLNQDLLKKIEMSYLNELYGECYSDTISLERGRKRKRKTAEERP